MIWNVERGSGARPSGIADHLAEMLASVYGQNAALSAEDAEELARAVDCFVAEYARDGAVDSRSLVMLASQAMCSLGEGEAARRFLILGSGLVKPSEWEVTPGETMWILDLKQMTLRDNASLELILFGSLRIILEAVADLWDETAGRGVLGLRHVCSAVGALADGKKHAGADLSDEVKRLCAHKLAQIGRERGWSACPRVMNLDL